MNLSRLNIYATKHKDQDVGFQEQAILNTSYFTDSYIVFTLKMESQPKNIIFGLKMMVKSGLEKFILNSLHAGRWLFLLLNKSYLTDSYIVFTLKMESVFKNIK